MLGEAFAVLLGVVYACYKIIEFVFFTESSALPESSARTIKKKPNLCFKPIHELKAYLPSKDALQIDKYVNISYMNYYNMSYVFQKLLQIEDIENLKPYIKLTKTQRVRLSSSVIGTFTLESVYDYDATILQPMDDVLLLHNKTLLSENDILNFMLKNPVSEGIRYYLGKIEEISDTQKITIKCTELRYNDMETFTVIFRPARFVLRYQYRALELLKEPNIVLKRILYPDNVYDGASNYTTQKLKNFFNLQISQNQEQRHAVEQVVQVERFLVPYIIFGPPGTGKTATVVECILQLRYRRPETRILVMANTNTACDVLALRLLQKNADKVLRIFSRSAQMGRKNIDKLLLQHSNLSTPEHYYPTVEHIHGHHIIICTLSTAGKLALGDFGCNGKYTHIFVDEAAACTEPELLMGIVPILRTSPLATLIISGDHKQLGPVIQSKTADKLGLGISFLERLVMRKCYQVDAFGNYNNCIQTRLRQNYRSHREIVNLYNHLFYNDELKAKATTNGKLLLPEILNELINRKFPIIFHDVYGQTQHRPNSKSLYNLNELDLVMFYVETIMNFGLENRTLQEQDIGIISPYKDQCHFIQKKLNKLNWRSIECGSVESFQGKENRIIIVSFVRSGGTLGFLENRRRLNVTLSRPISLLIMIGNIKTLSNNSDYKYIIEACKSHNTIVRNDQFKTNIKVLPDPVYSSGKKRGPLGKKSQPSDPTYMINPQMQQKRN